MRRYFEGIYYKHQKQGNTLCLIVGCTNNENFIQVITNDCVYQYDFQDGCQFSLQGISVNLPHIKGRVQYGPPTRLATDIMGPFRFLPMQCSHQIYSMRHTLRGFFVVDGNYINLNGGLGYIEGDRGHSFPKRYLWLHCNDFHKACSIMVSVAHIPFCGFSFTGCICAIIYEGQEYRLATYKGVRIIEASANRIHLQQGRFRLLISICPQSSHPLRAPLSGRMTQTIHESNCSHGRFRFFIGKRQVFDLRSKNVSFENN